MARHSLVGCALVISALTVLGVAGFGLSDASAAPVAGPVQCSAGAGRLGVAVVVVTAESSPPQLRCVDLAQRSNGVDALRSAGFALRIEAGFICGISGVPSTGCATTGSATGPYWHYYKADGGGEWRYSNVGAGSRIKAAGDCAVEGWVWSGFDDKTPPRVDPRSISCNHRPTAPPATAPPTTRRPQTTVPSTSTNTWPASTVAVPPGPGVTADDAESGEWRRSSPNDTGTGSAQLPEGELGLGDTSGVELDADSGEGLPGSGSADVDATNTEGSHLGSTDRRSDGHMVAPGDGAEGQAVGVTDADGDTASGSPLALMIGIVIVAAIAGTAVRLRHSRG